MKKQKKTETKGIAELVNDLFNIYRHPDGREFTHKEVEEGITKRAGKKLIDASYLSKIRTGALKKPGIIAIEALCHFFPVEPDYFFPNIVALREHQAQKTGAQLPIALRAMGADPAVLREQLKAVLRGLTSPEDSTDNDEG